MHFLDCPELNIGPEDIAVILCTSGTTGKSKGAIHTHKSLMVTVHLCSYFPLTYPEPNLLLCKATHVGAIMLPMAVMALGFSAVCTPDLSPQGILKCIERMKVRIRRFVLFRYAVW